MKDNWAKVGGWSLDFVRALRDRPFWVRWLVPILFGKYAYREFIGLMDTLRETGYLPYFEYGLQGMDYHKERMPFRWWVEREAKPGGEREP